MTAVEPGRHPAAVACAFAASLGASGVLIGLAWNRVAGSRLAPWIIGRAAGLASYLLLVALVVLGLVLSHPARARRGGSTPGRIRAHIALALFTLAFTALHVVVLATDRFAGVGWWGTLVPMGSSYRPAAVTLGLVGMWSGLLVGLTAAAAGRLPRRVWWPVHKVAAVSLVLIWLHGVLAGGDTPALLGLYLGTGALTVAVAISRYTSRRAVEVRR
ncbi:MAG: hypothetical protein ABI429_08565 [Jatrophihabitantaceae bacterium]